MRWIWLLPAICCLWAGVLSAAPDDEAIEARTKLREAIVAKARAHLADDSDNERGALLVDVTEAVWPGAGIGKALAREVEQGKVKRPVEVFTDTAFADYLAQEAAFFRSRRHDGSSDLAIILARLALLYNPDHAAARRLVPKDDNRASFDGLLADYARLRGRQVLRWRENRERRDIAETLRKVQIPAFTLKADDGAENLNALIRLAADLDIPLRIAFSHTPASSGGSYKGRTLVRSSHLAAPARDRTLENCSFLHLVHTVTASSGLRWTLDGETVTITDSAPANTEAAPDQGALIGRTIPTRHAAALHRTFKESVSRTLQEYRGKEVRVVLTTANLDAVKWRNSILTLDGFRIDMSQGAAEDLSRCAELAKAAANRSDRKRLRITVTGEIYNYVSGVIYMRKPDQLAWEWVSRNDRGQR